jgi:hypothetical protein
MKTLLCLALLALGGPLTIPAQQTAPPQAAAWERSLVVLDVTRKSYDYFQPWNRRQAGSQKTGVVIGEHHILTTADELYDATLVRLQKGGRGKWWTGTLSWVDYHANLALVTTEDEDFWRELRPVELHHAAPTNGALQIVRWRNGKLETRQAEFTQFTVAEGQLSTVNHVQLEVSSEIEGVGRGEPVIMNSHVLGLVTAQRGRTCIATPAAFITSILDARRAGRYRGLGYFHFYWQPAENPASLAYLGLPGEPRGVLVIDVPRRPDGRAPVLRPKDIILQIDEFAVDTEGDYLDPDFGHLMIENLATRRKWAGDPVKIQVWREGQTQEVTYHLPKFDYTNSLVPDAVFDQAPEYLIVGGLVFQPLTDPYLRGWGRDWRRQAPFRLYYYNEQPATEERPALVLLSLVLPDPYNIGYQDLRGLVVDKVNGRRISRVAEIRDALKTPVDGFHIVEFMKGDSLQRLVLAAGEAERAATRRVLQRYGITEEFSFAARAAN